jgi:hypothetical protein
MKRLKTLAALGLSLAGILALGCSLALGDDAKGNRMDPMATYEVIFVPSWNPASHVEDYPITHAKKGLLTPMIGATHGDDYRLFGAGQKPTPGLERLSEMGKHNPLDNEIRAAVEAGKAGFLIEASAGSEGPVHAPVTLRFEITRRYPTVSLVGMIAPSPDWFYGASVTLLEDGQWAPSMIVPAYAWDSGGDAGTTYMADDSDLEPKENTKLSDFPAFFRGGKRIPVGTFVFKLVPASND